MTLARSLSTLAAVVLATSLAVLAGCSGKTIGTDLNTPVDPTDPTDPTDPKKPDSGACEENPPECDPGDQSVGSEANCGGADYCYSRAATCTATLVWCAHRTVQCGAVPTCDQGDSPVNACPPPTPGPGGGGSSCYQRTMCGSTITCFHQDSCNTLPTCDPGDQEVTAVDTCNKANVLCYSRTACNFTIQCWTVLHPAPPPSPK